MGQHFHCQVCINQKKACIIGGLKAIRHLQKDVMDPTFDPMKYVPKDHELYNNKEAIQNMAFIFIRRSRSRQYRTIDQLTLFDIENCKIKRYFHDTPRNSRWWKMIKTFYRYNLYKSSASLWYYTVLPYYTMTDDQISEHVNGIRENTVEEAIYNELANRKSKYYPSV